MLYKEKYLAQFLLFDAMATVKQHWIVSLNWRNLFAIERQRNSYEAPWTTHKFLIRFESFLNVISKLDCILIQLSSVILVHGYGFNDIKNVFTFIFFFWLILCKIMRRHSFERCWCNRNWIDLWSFHQRHALTVKIDLKIHKL